MAFIVLYGPPGAGKLTVAQELAELTGYRLYDNHLTVNPVRALFEFGTPDFVRVLKSVRSQLLLEAARARLDLIFTVNAARGIDPPVSVHDSIGEIDDVAREHAIDVRFVHIEPSRDELERRLVRESRLAKGKLVDVQQLRRQLEGWDGKPLDPSHLSIDNTDVSPAEAARRIHDHFLQ